MATPNITPYKPDDVLQPGAEREPAAEAEAVTRLRALLRKIHEGQSTGPTQRGQHPKQHGGLWATFRVESNIPEQMRVGLFANPHTYTALVRLSNGGSPEDTQPAVHAMAVKILVPDGKNPPRQQDFIVADNPVFFARNVEHMFEFVETKTRGTLDASKFPQLKGFARVAEKGLLDLTYWSQTPYKLGAGAVKYLVRPSDDSAKPAIGLNTSRDFLREELIERLTFQKIGASFDFCVNPQLDAHAMPVEDPTVEWTSPAVCLAKLTIYPQKFDSPEQMDYFGNLSWSPWNTLPEHSPLGGINRARKLIYDDSTQLRHSASGKALETPSGRESF